MNKYQINFKGGGSCFIEIELKFVPLLFDDFMRNIRNPELGDVWSNADHIIKLNEVQSISRVYR
jgi:hypothetical protein